MANKISVNANTNSVTVLDPGNKIPVTINRQAVNVTAKKDTVNITQTKNGVAVSTPSNNVRVSQPTNSIRPTFKHGISIVNNIDYNNGILTGIANGTVSAYMVLSSFDGLVRVADKDTPDDVNAVLGITTTGGIDGDTITIIVNGEVDNPSWSWTLNQPIFLGNAGALTQTPPTTGFSQILAMPLTTTKIYFQRQTPVVL